MLTKKEVEMYRDAEFLKHLCDDSLAMRKMLEEIAGLVKTHVCIWDGEITVTCGNCLHCKLKELLG